MEFRNKERKGVLMQLRSILRALGAHTTRDLEFKNETARFS